MSGNSAFVLVNERGWRRGLRNLLDNEFAAWWRTKRWLKHTLIWVGIVGGILAATAISSPSFRLEEGAVLYGVFAGIFPAVAVVILMQDALVGEKHEGTAAWVLSKPVSRPAFILSKAVANGVGVLVTMVVMPGIAAYVILSVASGEALNPWFFATALGVVFLGLLFYLTFTLMLGALFRQRGAVIGLGLALVFAQQFLIGLVPPLANVLPWTLSIPVNDGQLALVQQLLQGQAPQSYTQPVIVALESVLFLAICLWRFEREEF